MTLKLEVGKCYETECGDREHVVAYVPVNPITGKPNPRPYVAMNKEGDVFRYREDGRLCTDGSPSVWDFIREHVPPPTLKEVCEDVDKWLGQFGGLSLSTAAEAIHRKVQTALAAEKAKVGQ